VVGVVDSHSSRHALRGMEPRGSLKPLHWGSADVREKKQLGRERLIGCVRKVRDPVWRRSKKTIKPTEEKGGEKHGGGGP